ncbi:MAG: hypothetical protein K8R58_12700, partial [Bacteroidales bacterium]|nr:hypothetical protein [Bacteroidales bacterium]
VKIATLEQVKKKLNANIDKTVQRYLKELCFFTSYSHKGKYYTHQRIADFDENGLWTYKGVHFSIHYKLINTIEIMIKISEKGYCSSELHKLLFVNVNDTLLKLVNNKKLTRKKIEKRFYYFSNIPAIKKHQLLLCKSVVGIKYACKLNIKKTPDINIRRGFALFFNQLDEKQKRLYSGLESAQLGYGGDKIISETFDIDPHTVSRGRKEILSGNFEKNCIRKVGGGRFLIKKKSTNN